MKTAERAFYPATVRIVDDPEHGIGNDGRIEAAVADFPGGADDFKQVGPVVEFQRFGRRDALSGDSFLKDIVCFIGAKDIHGLKNAHRITREFIC